VLDVTKTWRGARRSPGCDPCGEVPPVGEVEHQERLLALGLAHVVDGHQVLTADASQQVPLDHEALAHIRVEAVVLGQHLHGDVDVEPLVAGAIDRGEPAGADHLLDEVAPHAMRQARSH